MTMAMVEKGFVQVEGTKLYYETAGEGEPVLLVHGAFMTAAIWDSTVAALSDRYRTIRFDMRGMGRSKLGTTPYRSHEDMGRLLDALGAEAVHIVGLSAGGQLAAEFALAYPSRVKSLTLVAAGMFGIPETERKQADDAAFYEAAGRGDMEAALRLWTLRWLCGPGQPEERVDASVREAFAELSRAGLSGFATFEMPQLLDPPALGRLGDIAVPALVVVGDLDYDDALHAADTIAAAIPDCRMNVLKGCAHIPPMDRPEKFNGLLADFLESV
ncbi:alpha/beta fold hydrolase [Paenibacillus flagellatus]|uniref:Pimeloyl-CoA synthetase n=1 Tax=Paenibacillus flagellatus TaxID=2211139 RepID=A0A2V5K9W5_9BACL|nr:alpha/beta hydrolase [Paenibacillus flagellatus]PYI56329.1 pimeloyl-CoA synthetase [Paenibacillus flagellatus]